MAILIVRANDQINQTISDRNHTDTSSLPLQIFKLQNRRFIKMKWIRDIKANTRPWIAFLSGFTVNTSDGPDDTAIINAYFATYLQNVAADQIKPVSCQTDLLSKKPVDSCDANSKHSEKPLRALSPLKQVV